MPPKKPTMSAAEVDQVIAEAKRQRELREKTYRERALKLFPWVCARCGREFSGKKLRELTVHHKDHNHDHNPLDGSNWELLCLYCHDHEHAKHLDAEHYGEVEVGREQKPSATYKAFAGLEALLKDKS